MRNFLVDVCSFVTRSIWQTFRRRVCTLRPKSTYNKWYLLANNRKWGENLKVRSKNRFKQTNRINNSSELNSHWIRWEHFRGLGCKSKSSRSFGSCFNHLVKGHNVNSSNLKNRALIHQQIWCNVNYSHWLSKVKRNFTANLV